MRYVNIIEENKKISFEIKEIILSKNVFQFLIDQATWAFFHLIVCKNIPKIKNKVFLYIKTQNGFIYQVNECLKFDTFYYFMKASKISKMKMKNSNSKVSKIILVQNSGKLEYDKKWF